MSSHSPCCHQCQSISKKVTLEVKGINTERMRTIYENMTESRDALRLLSIGIVSGISSVVQPPCEDPDPF